MFVVMEFLDVYSTEAIAALAGVAVILLLLTLIQGIRLASLRRRFNAIWRGSEQRDLEALLVEHARLVDEATARVLQMEDHCSRLEADAERHLQHLGVVRFNAFADTGSDQSFAIALLDEHQDGVVLSSLYGRNESRVYAKPIAAGDSTYFLTAEEKEALERAISLPSPQARR